MHTPTMHDRLRERGVHDAPFAELGLQPLRGPEDTALGADVLTEDHDSLVAAHLIAHPLADGLEIALGGHQESSA